MALPKQVQEQIDQTESLEAELYGDQPPADPAKPVAVVAPEQTVPAAEPVAVPVPAEATPVQQEDENSPTWKQKYKTLQGMYDAEVPRLHAQVTELTTQNTSLGSRIEALEEKAKGTKPAPVEEQPRNLVTDEDREEFGADLIEVQRKVAQEVVADVQQDVEAVRAENAKLQEQVDQNSNTVAVATFEQSLARLVPDFAQINVDPAWIAWLNEVDPMLRGPRMVAAQGAFSKGDAEAVAHYVKLFKETQEQPAATPTPSELELESQIQPSTATPSQPTTTQSGETLSDADVRSMFRKVMELNAVGNHEEARKLEAKIDAAYSQGRVVA